MTITERIVELREYAREDGENCNESSISDFLAFPSTIAGMEGPYIFMQEKGDIRAMWRSRNRRFNIEFFGEGKIEVIVVLLYLLAGKVNREVSYVDLAGMPAELSEESFLAFLKEHSYESRVF